MNEISFNDIIEIFRIIFLALLWFILVFRFIKEESDLREIKRKINKELAERKKEE